MKEGLFIKGEALIQRVRDGKIIDSEHIKNLVVNTGKERVAKLIGGISSTTFDSIGIGTGTTAPSASDTSLETEAKRLACDSGSPAYEADYKVTFEKTFTFGSAESYAITEAGVFDGVGSGATMLDRLTFTAKNVDSDTDLYVKITITVSTP